MMSGMVEAVTIQFYISRLSGTLQNCGLLYWNKLHLIFLIPPSGVECVIFRILVEAVSKVNFWSRNIELKSKRSLILGLLIQPHNDVQQRLIFIIDHFLK